MPYKLQSINSSEMLQNLLTSLLNKSTYTLDITLQIPLDSVNCETLGHFAPNLAPN